MNTKIKIILLLLLVFGVLQIIFLTTFSHSQICKTVQSATQRVFGTREVQPRLNVVSVLSLNELKHILSSIEDVQTSLNETNKEQIQQLKDISVLLRKRLGLTNQRKHGSVKLKSAPDGQTKPQREVCPESYNHPDLSSGYPFFYKGFDEQNCTDVQPLHNIITIAYNFANISLKQLETVQNLIKRTRKLYPRLTIIIAYSINVPVCDNNTWVVCGPNTKTVTVGEDWNEAQILHQLASTVKTKYVFVGYDMFYLTWHLRLTRLIRALTDLSANIATPASRDNNGEWLNGCYQITLKNYTLKLESGYHESSQECLYCDVTTGPFVTRTELLHGIQSYSNIIDWMIDLKGQGNTLISCPDSMAFINNHVETHWEKRNYWLDMVNARQIEVVKLASGTEHHYTCEEAKSECEKRANIVLSHCCINRLSFIIKTFMRLCEESGSICELQEGTLLGAVKFNGVLPWERDGDLTFSSSNFTAVKNLNEHLKKHGISLSAQTQTRCCFENRITGGTMMLHDSQSSWSVELYGQHFMDSEKLMMEGLDPTRIWLDGQLVATPTSPGLFARNRYGAGIYKHVQHWMTVGHDSGWKKYKISAYPECPQPGHHACLDQYNTDGNIQFQHP